METLLWVVVTIVVVLLVLALLLALFNVRDIQRYLRIRRM